MADSNFAIYGANGYTGELIAREAVARGFKPVLAGRNSDRIKQLGVELGCEGRVYSLENPKQVAEQLRGLRAVLHCAGPFSATAATMREACILAGVSYLDITGELEVIEAAAACHERAVQAGVSILPAVGMDVVPTDCLAAMLAEELPGATHLQLAIYGLTSLSPGTTKTVLEALPRGGRVRLDGKIARVPTAWKVMEVPFPSKPRLAMTIPWGDVASAYHSTGIPNIEVYMSYRPDQIRWAKRMRWLLPLLKIGLVQRLLRKQIEKKIKGPSAAELQSSRTEFWGRVSGASGRSVEGTITCANGYKLTVLTALASAERVLSGTVRPGFATPSQAFGRDFVREIPGVEVHIGTVK